MFAVAEIDRYETDEHGMCHAPGIRREGEDVTALAPSRRDAAVLFGRTLPSVTDNVG